MHRSARLLVVVCAGCVLLGVQAGRFAASLPPARAVTAVGHWLPLGNKVGFYQALDQIERKLLGTPLVLVADEKRWQLVGLQAGVSLDRSAMWQDAVGRRSGEGRFAYFLRTQLLTRKARQLELRLTYDQKKLDDYLAELGAEFWQPSRNARLDPHTGEVLAETLGRRLDVPATRERLLNSWRTGAKQVAAVVHRVVPATTSDMLHQIKPAHVIARYSSYFDAANTGRVANIATAASFLDGYVVRPGEEFSFNAAVGPRTLERGFHYAEEIVNQELVPGIGGGVCQVSSTLYNAALLAGLQITQRQHHSRPLGYVALGRDATVYYGTIDFRFRNMHSFPLVLSAVVSGNRLTVAVHAPEQLDVEYEVVSTDVKELPPGEVYANDPTVPPGEVRTARQGQSGWEVRTWRVARSPAGHEISREQIAFDRYLPQPTVLQVNQGVPRPMDAPAVAGTAPRGTAPLPARKTSPQPLSPRPQTEPAEEAPETPEVSETPETPQDPAADRPPVWQRFIRSLF